MVVFVISMGILLWLAYRARADGEIRLVREIATGIMYVAAVLVLLPILFYVGVFCGAVVGGAATFLGADSGVATALSLAGGGVPVVIVIIVCALRLCDRPGKARTPAPSARAKRKSHVALPPPFDDNVERVVWKIARDRADMLVSEFKRKLRRFSPRFNVPPAEGQRVDEELEQVTSKIARDRADMLMRQRKKRSSSSLP